MDANEPDGKLILIACLTFAERCRRRAAKNPTQFHALDLAITEELRLLKLEVAEQMGIDTKQGS